MSTNLEYAAVCKLLHIGYVWNYTSERWEPYLAADPNYAMKDQCTASGSTAASVAQQARPFEFDTQATVVKEEVVSQSPLAATIDPGLKEDKGFTIYKNQGEDVVLRVVDQFEAQKEQPRADFFEPPTQQENATFFKTACTFGMDIALSRFVDGRNNRK